MNAARRVRRLATMVAAALLIAGCSAPAVRFASPSETQQATRTPGQSQAGSGSTATAPSPAPTAAVSPPAGSGALSQFQQTLQQLASEVAPSVVEIRTASGLGSGIVFDSYGDIVTNAHVVDQPANLNVVTYDGHQFSASVVGSYTQNDLAVIRASGADGLRPATFGDSSKVKVGDIVLAIGAPFGLNSSVTDGIVSAVGRAQSEGNGVVLTDLIQTSAGINPGNSGGALVDITGKVIGIPTLSGTDNQQRGQPSENIGFAIPSNQVVDISHQLIANGSVAHTGRAYLGITSRDDSGGGVLVVSTVAGGPAAKAGIQAGWVITDLGSHAVADGNTLTQVLSGYKPGDRIQVALRLPDGSTKKVSVQLGERPVNP